MNHRYQIIDTFELGDSKELEKLSYGERIVRSRNMLLDMKTSMGLDIDNRVFSKAFYGSRSVPKSKEMREIWSKKDEKRPKRKRQYTRKKITGDKELPLELEDDNERHLRVDLVEHLDELPGPATDLFFGLLEGLAMRGSVRLSLE